MNYLRYGTDWRYLPQKMKRKSFIKPPFRIYTVRPREDGSSALYVIRNNNVAEPYSIEACTGLIWSWLNGLPDIFKELKINLNQAEQVVKGLLKIEPVSKSKPKMVAFKSDNSVCLKKHDWDPVFFTNDQDAIAAAPEAMQLLTNPENHKHLAAWIGSALDDRCDRKRVLWVYGPKDCGKSQLYFILNEIFGNVAPVDNETFKAKEFTGYIENSRIAVINESSNYILMSNKFKNLTGDSMHPIRHLYRSPYMGEIRTLFMFLSNNEPGVDNDPAVLSRIIPCKMTPVEDDSKMPEVDFQCFLRDALPIITGYCIKKYEFFGSLSMRNDYTTEDLDDAVYYFNINENSWIEEHIEFDENIFTTPGVLEKRFRYCGLSPKVKGKIRTILLTEKNVKRVKDQDGKRWLKGMRVNMIKGELKQDDSNENGVDVVENTDDNVSNLVHLKAP